MTILLNLVSDNKSLEELPVVCLLVTGFMVYPVASSSLEQETIRKKPIAKIAAIFLKFLKIFIDKYLF